MRIYFSLLTILFISFLFSFSLLFKSNSNISHSIFHSYYSNFNFSLQISIIISSIPLFFDLLRNLYQHTLRAFHVSTLLFVFSSLCDLILLIIKNNQIFGFIFNYREISFLIGLFSLIYHHRNIVNLHYSSILGAALWTFGFTSGILTHSHFQDNQSLLAIPFVPIFLALISTTYDYFRWVCDKHLNPEKYRHKTKQPPSIQNNTSTQILHTDYSVIIFVLIILLGCSHLYFFCSLYLPSISFPSAFSNIKTQHLSILIKSCVTLIIICYANIYPYLMAYRDMEVSFILLIYFLF